MTSRGATRNCPHIGKCTIASALTWGMWSWKADGCMEMASTLLPGWRRWPKGEGFASPDQSTSRLRTKWRWRMSMWANARSRTSPSRYQSIASNSSPRRLLPRLTPLCSPHTPQVQVQRQKFKCPILHSAPASSLLGGPARRTHTAPRLVQ